MRKTYQLGGEIAVNIPDIKLTCLNLIAEVIVVDFTMASIVDTVRSSSTFSLRTSRFEGLFFCLIVNVLLRPFSILTFLDH